MLRDVGEGIAQSVVDQLQPRHAEEQQESRAGPYHNPQLHRQAVEEHHKEIAQSHQQRQQHKAEGEGEQRVDKGGPKAHAFQVKEGEEHVG